MENARKRWVGLWATLIVAGSFVCEFSARAEDASTLVDGEARNWGFMPNGLPVRNEHGLAATFSTQGEVNLEGAFFTPQGTNGRSCDSCHSPQAGWSMSAALLQQVFEESAGLAPVFNALDADRGGADPVGTLEQRRYAYSMLLQGKFTRNQTPPANAEFRVVAAEDPFGIGSTTRFWFFRRAMPTANFKNHIVSWDGANTVGTSLHDGLARQARGNITGAQQGTPPADEGIVQEIVAYEKALSHAQLIVEGVGRVDVGGARGGPEQLSKQPLVAGRFDLFDAWLGSPHPRRAQIARGQEIFNTPRPSAPRAPSSPAPTWPSTRSRTSPPARCAARPTAGAAGARGVGPISSASSRPRCAAWRPAASTSTTASPSRSKRSSASTKPP